MCLRRKKEKEENTKEFGANKPKASPAFQIYL